jgi:hypothetical protein
MGKLVEDCGTKDMDINREIKRQDNRRKPITLACTPISGNLYNRSTNEGRKQHPDKSG